jgi:hypothetical protein
MRSVWGDGSYSGKREDASPGRSNAEASLMRLGIGRNVLVVILGAAVSWVVVGISVWVLARTGLIPVWRLAQIAAESQTGKAATDDAEVFALLLAMRWYSEWVVGPAVAAVVGALVGSLARTHQWLCALIAILPVGIMLTGFPSGRAWRGLLVTAVVSVACAHLAGLGMKLMRR